MLKWEKEPKQHNREAPWALFDLLCLFPLKSQLSKTFFFFGDSSTWAISAFSNSSPASPAPSGSVIGGDSSLSVMHGAGSPKQICGDAIAKRHQGGVGGRGRPVCWFSLCGEGGVKGKAGMTQGGTKLSPCSSRNIFGTALWQREGFVWAF